MINDPYQVLGVSRNSTPEEIKSAYRKLAKQYHPDLHPNDPNAALKMNEINEAYDMLTHPEKYNARRQQEQARQNAYQGFYGNGNPFGGYQNQNGSNQNQNGYQGTGGWYSNFYGFDFEDFFNAFNGYSTRNETVSINPEAKSDDSSDVRSAIENINAGRYEEALRILMRVPHSGRNARWYYLNGIAYYGYSDTSQAAEYMAQAVRMEPENTTYKDLYSRFTQEGRTYYRNTTTIVNPFRRIGRLILFIIVIRFIFRLLTFLMYGMLPVM